MLNRGARTMKNVLVPCLVVILASCSPLEEEAILSTDPSARSLQCYAAARATRNNDLYGTNGTSEGSEAIELRDASRITQTGWIAVLENPLEFSNLGDLYEIQKTMEQDVKPVSYWVSMLKQCHSAYPETSDNNVISLPSEDDEALLQCYSLAEHAALDHTITPPRSYREFVERNLERFAYIIETRGLLRIGASPLEEGSVGSITSEYSYKTAHIGRPDRVLEACLARFPE